MRIERVSENKIKVTLDGDEARKNNITVRNISANTPEVQRMFWQAINFAKENINFSIDGAKLFVETIPTQDDGGIGMTITKVSCEKELEEAVKNCSYKGRIRKNELRPMKQMPPQRIRKHIYKFANFDSVCSVAGELREKYRGVSVLYKLDGAFYLYLIPQDALSLCESELILSEFAQKQVHSQYIHGKLNEYGEVMIDGNAVEVLSEYFCKV